MKVKKIAHLIALIGVAGTAYAQSTPPAQPVARVEITGSSIKRIAKEGALPVEIISRKQIDAQGIVTAEQLIATLSVNGTGSDNLASNADVTSGAQRGNNGASSANLRGQGSDSTLILLNGRRIATHGMKGQAVDLNSIPMAAVDRVEVLKDGASSTYGTDAIGGVINFILRKDYHGLEAQLFNDITQQGGANITRGSVTGGWGDLDNDGYNVLAALSHAESQKLRGDERDFVQTFQPNRGVSVDTRGTPYATIFATSLAPTLLSKGSAGATLPGGTQAFNGVNVLDLPGQAGCKSVPGMDAYDEKLWDSPAAAYGCAWDTGRAAVLQQPVTSDNAVLRGTWKRGEHQLFAEAVGSQTVVAKSFSPNQISPSASTFNATSFYPSTGAAYNDIYNALVKVFPSVAANYGLPIAYRWRCMECGNREIKTKTRAVRYLVGADGPLQLGGKTWDYRVGLSQAWSQSVSTLGTGYNYTADLAKALGSGIINPFLAPGQTQSQAAMDLIKSTSAEGVELYGGKSIMTELDATLSGELFNLPAGAVMGAVGMDFRREEYRFNGDTRDVSQRRAILNAPFDDVNALNNVSRNVKALFFEVAIPVFKSLEVTLSGREDRYDGFGNTFNPKASFRWNPVESVIFRGSYSSAFRAPAFNQLYNGVTESPYAGKDLADPATCASGKVDSNIVGCASVTPVIFTGGKQNLGPETAKMGTIGMVWEPFTGFSANADLWLIRRYDQIKSITLTDLVKNYNLFQDRFLHQNGQLVAIDQRWVNAGTSVTEGVEVGARYNFKALDARWTAGIDGTRLLEKKSKPLESADYGKSEVGVFTFTGDLGLKWKHVAYLNYQNGPWSALLQNIYRSGYEDQVLPGVASGKVVPSDYSSKVKAYSIYNVSLTYSGVQNLTVTGGIKNIFNTDPPFAITYDSNTGAGSTWEPRVADPRGRSLAITVNYKFL
ncbi:TonB-dependent receptor domain-containing protein [Zemynaea arenosa]|uniref:TonB-dependent receptor domain-containing protein n=1 Tax=Zemynaea arenosa TaxID=2561931 RepID=UPI001E5F99EC|nr:TonB-dependent receptor [Massilia arenosa]